MEVLVVCGTMEGYGWVGGWVDGGRVCFSFISKKCRGGGSVVVVVVVGWWKGKVQQMF